MVEIEFSESELHALVDSAIAAESTSVSYLRLDHIETELMETFSNLLEAKKVDPLIRSEIYQELKTVIVNRKKAVQPEDLYTVINNCKMCPNAIAKAEMPLGNLRNPEIVFVSDNSNNGGHKVLKKMLDEKGFQESSYALTYATRCRMSKPIGQEEVSNCSNYLLNELEMLHPSIIVPMGSAPTELLLGDVNITEARGNIFWLGEYRIIPIYSVFYAEKANRTNDLNQDLNFIYSKAYGG